jgi:hypothetical protein
MQPTMTTAEWLRRAADLWSDADATQDQEGRRIKIILAEGFERLAKHAAFLAEGDAYPSVDNVYPSLALRVRHLPTPLARKLRARSRQGGERESPGKLMTSDGPAQDACPDGPCIGGSPKPWLPERLARGLVALLATPFLLLAMLGIACWTVILRDGGGILRDGGGALENARRRSRWWLVFDIATALLGVATLDWLVDAF